MDVLNLQPDAINTVDSTSEIEGYDDHIEQIEQAYPEEDFRTPAEIEAEEQTQQEGTMQQASDQAFQEGSVAQEQPLGVAEAPQQPEQPQQTEQAPEPEGQASRFVVGQDGLLEEDSITDYDGHQLNTTETGRQLIQQLKLRNQYIPEKENKVTELLNGLNLENQLEAFTMIRNDPELTAILDHNNDGEITYDDFFDTTNLNGGNGMTDEEDRIATEEWLSGLQGKDPGSRLRAIHQKYGAGQNMALLVLAKRRGYFDPSAGEVIKDAGGGAWFEIGQQTLETIGNVGAVMQGKSWEEGSTWDDDVLQHKNPMSQEFLINNPIATNQYSKGVYHGTYWVTSGLMVAASGGAAGGALASTKVPALVKAGTAIKGFTTGAQGLGKAVVADTIIPGAFRDMQEEGVGLMHEDALGAWTVKTFGGEAVLGNTAVMNNINSPHFKKMDMLFTESALGYAGGKAIQYLGRNIPRLIGGGTKFAQKNLDQLAVSTRSWSTKVNAEMLNQQAVFQKTQQQFGDLAEAAQVQAGKGVEGFRNAFVGSDEAPGLLHSSYGAYKNGAKLLGQGYSKARTGIRQAVNDLDEIRHSIFTPKGSTDALFNQTQMAKSAKGGITDPWFDDAAEELMKDNVWKSQIDAKDPLKNTRRVASPSAEQGIREVMGRDAASLDPIDFWGAKLLDQPLNVDDFNKLTDFDKWAVKNIEVQDAVNQQLLLQLRDSANAAGAMVGKTDLYAVDGAMRRIADNLVVGLSQVKKTQYTWDLARQMLKEGDGTLNSKQLIDLAADVSKRSRQIHNETRQGVQLMGQMLQEQGDDELAEALLDVFKVSNDVHNWKDFDAFMRQKITGGEFRGKVNTGALIHELQGVMVQSMLSGPKTPLRAILGTTTNAYLNAINEAAGAMIRSPLTGDIASRKASVAKMKGMFELVPEAWEVFKKNWNSKFDADFADIRTRYNEAPTRHDELWNAEKIWTEARGSDGDKAALYLTNTARTLNNNKLLGWSPRALAATDDTFKWLLARARSKEVAMRQVLSEAGDDWTKVTPDILKKAEDIHYKHLLDGEGNINLSKDSWLKKQFEEVTLTSELKGFSQKLDGLLNETPLMKPFYLFARTGLNGLNLTVKNTPLLGALHKESLDIMRHSGDDFTKLARYGIENANDLANARNLLAGRQAVGSTVVMGMGGMYAAGQLTGNGPADRQLKQQWINAGWKPNHVYVGDVGFDYSSLEPYNVIFSSIADIGDNIELMGSEWAEKRLQAVAFVLGRGLTSKTYMSGLDQLMQVVQMKPGALTKTGANILNNSIPLAGMRNEFGKWANPHMKELNSDMWDSIRNRNQATEFLAGENQLPEKSDLLNGKPIRNWNIVGRSFNAVSPVSLDIRNDTPGRRLLLDSNYDLKSTTYSYGGYSFVKDNHVRAHFQNAIGTVPITVGFKKFKNVEEALNHLASRSDVKTSMDKMRSNSKNPANWDIDPNDYPHNTLIDNVMDQARSKAWAKINDPSHKGYARLQALKSEQDGKEARTRDTRSEILELNYPSKQVEQFPK